MDVDARSAMRPFGHHTRQKGYLLPVKQVSNPLDCDGLKARISKHDFLEAPCRRVTRISGLYVGLKQGAYRRDS